MGQVENEISEHVLEIRFKANPKILDYRGSWVETISKVMDLRHWKIESNRIDVFDDNRRAFISHRNFGIIIKNSPTRNYFPEQGNKLVRFLFEQEPFGKLVFIDRIGVRSRFAVRVDSEFQELVERYLENFISIKSEVKRAFNGSVIDFGGSLNFKTEKGFLNTTNGPMGAEQLREFFPNHDEIPDISFFLDLDYWKKPEKELDKNELARVVKEFAEDNWETKESMINLLCGVKK